MSTALKLATLLKRVASATEAGLVKVNGNGINITEAGVLSSTAVTKKLQLATFISGQFSANATTATHTDVNVSGASIPDTEITAVFLNGSLLKFTDDYTLVNGSGITTAIVIKTDAVLDANDVVTVLRTVPV